MRCDAGSQPRSGPKQRPTVLSVKVRLIHLPFSLDDQALFCLHSFLNVIPCRVKPRKHLSNPIEITYAALNQLQRLPDAIGVFDRPRQRCPRR